MVLNASATHLAAEPAAAALNKSLCQYMTMLFFIAFNVCAFASAAGAQQQASWTVAATEVILSTVDA
jgi:hypothetical protein